MNGDLLRFLTIVSGSTVLACLLGICLDLVTANVAVEVTVQQGHMGCRCRGTPGVGASQRRLGCRWWGGQDSALGGVGAMPCWQG
jgi:hypothetical protein